MLGIGGLRVLRALGFTLRTYHLNEGHAALLTVELLKRYPKRSNMRNRTAPVTMPARSDACLFTTHTPVEAGHDKFDYDLVERVLGDEIDIDEARRYAGDDGFNMTKLALNLSGFVNGVATRHAETTQQMFPGYRVTAITNGIHAEKWAYPPFAHLFDQLIPSWKVEPELLFHADHLPDADVIDAKAKAKADLIDLVTEVTGIALTPRCRLSPTPGA